MLKVLNENVLIELDKIKAVTDSGIILAGQKKTENQFGTVCFPGCRVRYDLKSGDRVVVPKHLGTELIVDSKHYLILDSNKIYAKIN
jgi:co-chaperonin GroES (HSP10)